MAKLNQIFEALQQSGSTIRLNAALLGNAEDLKASFRKHFWNHSDSIVITGADGLVLNPEEQSITFGGIGEGGLFHAFPLSVIIYERQDSILVGVYATPPDGWKLTETFPTFNNPVSSLVALNHCRFFWESGDHEGLQMAEGFYSEGVPDFSTGPLALLSFLFGSQPNRAIFGDFEMVGAENEIWVEYLPQGQLSMDLSNESISLGPFTLRGPELNYTVASTFNQTDFRWQNQVQVGVSCATDLRLGETNYRILFQSRYSSGGTLELQAISNLSITGALSQLAVYAGIGEIKLPGIDLKFLDKILLKDISMVLQLDPSPSVQMVSFLIGTAEGEKMELWNEGLYLQDIELLIDIHPQAETKVSGSITGVVNGWLRLSAELSEDYLTLLGSLERNVSIAELYEVITGQKNDALPDLEISRLSLQVGLPRKKNNTTFSAGFYINGTWEIIKNPVSIRFHSLLLEIGRDAEKKYNFEIAGLAGIGKYQIGLSAKYTTDEQWTLAGRLFLADTEEKLATISGQLDTQFSVQNPPALPNWLTAWRLINLQTQFNTKTKNFDFLLALRNESWNKLSFDFGVHLINEDKSFTKKLDAKATYETKDFDVTFALKLTQKDEKESKSRTTTLTGEYSSQKPPKLSHLLVAIAGQMGIEQKLPNELAVDAAVTGAGIILSQKDSDPIAVEAAATLLLEIQQFKLNFLVGFTNHLGSDKDFKKRVMVKEKPAFALGAALGGTFDLSGLPVIGKLPGLDSIVIERLGFFYTNAEASSTKKVYFKLPKVGPDSKLIPTGDAATLTRQGFNLMASFGKRDDVSKAVKPWGQFELPLDTGKTPPKEEPKFSEESANPDSPITWLDINKTIGPVTLARIGLGYRNGEASFGVSGSIALGTFALNLVGMSLTFPMPLKGQPSSGKFAFELLGLAINITAGGLTLGGAFLKDVDAKTGITSYFGMVLVQMGSVSFKALGGFTPAQKDSHGKDIPAAFFIYANLNAPIGGPPQFQISGLAGGLGINNRLILPEFEDLSSYILLPNMAPPMRTTAKDTMGEVLPKLQKTFRPDPGTFWFAAGIRFSSFQMINAFALLTVSLGNDFQIGLLGTASMSFPPAANPPVAGIEINFMATFTPATGRIAVAGVLTPASFLIGDFCKLTGGFAFYLWFAGEHTGDFVMTVGGYHPRFKIPDHYPKVPRLGINFELGPLHVEGGGYFALTPSQFMVGLAIQATFEIPSVKAWFDLGVHFLIAWAPFHYEADAYVYIGCAVNLGLFTLNMHVGASISVWGPPFGGTAEVDLSVVKFTIAFGGDQEVPTPLSWSEFRNQFLPADPKQQEHKLRGIQSRLTEMGAASGLADAPVPGTQVLKASVARGLNDSDVQGFHWIVDPDHFILALTSTIPVNDPRWAKSEKESTEISNQLKDYNQAVSNEQLPHLVWNPNEETFSKELVWNPVVNIRLMKLKNVKSSFLVDLRKDNGAGNPASFLAALTATPVLTNSASALWAEDTDTPDANEEAFLKHSLTGFNLSPIPRKPSITHAVPLHRLLFQQGNEREFAYAKVEVDGSHTLQMQSSEPDQLNFTILGGQSPVELTNQGYRLESLNHEWVVNRRASLLDELHTQGFGTFASKETGLKTFAKETTLTGWPTVVRLADTTQPA